MKKIIMSGGGTAGHLYPGIAVSQKLKKKEPDIQILFVGSGRDVEKKIMSHHKVDFIALPIEGLKGRGWKILKSLFILPYAFYRSFRILLRIKPNLVVGLGGYSSGPIVYLASLMKIPTLIMEQNLKPGFTNKILLRRVQKAVVAFQNSLPYFRGKGIFLGNPAREEFHHLAPKQRNSKLSLLIFGGSQGSHFLNKSMINALAFLKNVRESLKIFHQTGEFDYSWVKENYEKAGFLDVTVAPFFFEMADYFQRSDIIICRSGATTIAELIASQKASILIPFAGATDNHQAFNARELEKIQGAEVILEKDFTPQLLAEKIIDLLNNIEKIERMESNLAGLKTRHTAENISNLCLKLMESNT
jgi:UDP-N-acetylglucosamine--N-acetylmuramyl-(pentapeptide) pyrophosphoryl-undecaprenol N-acetylglucosamine transferase